MHSPYVSKMVCFHNSIPKLEFRWKQSDLREYTGYQVANNPVFLESIIPITVQFPIFSKNNVGIPMNPKCPCEIELYYDSAPHSFGFRQVYPDGKTGIVGGLLYHGQPDQSFAILLNPIHGWSIHTQTYRKIFLYQSFLISIGFSTIKPTYTSKMELSWLFLMLPAIWIIHLSRQDGEACELSAQQ